MQFSLFSFFPPISAQVQALKCIKIQPVLFKVRGSWDQCQLLRKVICASEQNLQISKWVVNK